MLAAGPPTSELYMSERYADPGSSALDGFVRGCDRVRGTDGEGRSDDGCQPGPHDRSMSVSGPTSILPVVRQSPTLRLHQYGAVRTACPLRGSSPNATGPAI